MKYLNRLGGLASPKGIGNEHPAPLGEILVGLAPMKLNERILMTTIAAISPLMGFEGDDFRKFISFFFKNFSVTAGGRGALYLIVESVFADEVFADETFVADANLGHGQPGWSQHWPAYSAPKWRIMAQCHDRDIAYAFAYRRGYALVQAE